MSKDGLRAYADGTVRCWWPGDDPIYLAYHDDEWGRPVDDDDQLFEKICLEGFQAGLSWLTILKKRPAFRRAFAKFEIDAVARFNSRSVERLLGDAGIVRHRQKIQSTINNAKRAQDLRAEFGSVGAYVWRFEPPPSARPRRLDQAALRSLGKTEASTQLSKDLKRRGFSFVGPTTAYAFMQAMGIVNDHLEGCEMRPRIEAARASFVRPT